jgi:two-component system sensor histidine kinase RpfC
VVRCDFDLHAEIADLVAILRVQASRKGLRLAAHVSPEVPYRLHGDWDHLRQILTNLVANAIKFTDSGHVLISVRTREFDDSGQVILRFEVSDTGIGITAEDCARIFDRFTQADDAVNRRYGGAGLGLAISRNLVALLGGRIGVESEHGKGSTFWVDVPLGQQAETGAIEPRELPEHVFVLSHDGKLVEGIETHLANLKIDVIQVRSGEVAARAITDAGAKGILRHILIVDNRSEDWCLTPLVESLGAIQPRYGLSFVSIADPERRQQEDGTYVASLVASFSARGLINVLHAAYANCRGRPPERENELASVQAQQRRSGLRVLVAEDNAVNQKVTAKILESVDHKPFIVPDGDEALDCLNDQEFDLLILDINMPGTSGLDVIKLYRMANVGMPQAPIIALSADATRETQQASLEAGADAYLTKPVEAKKLLDTIDRLAISAEMAIEHPEEESAETIVAQISDHPRYKSEGQPTIDWAVIRQLLQYSSGDDFVIEIFQDFVADTESLLTSIETAACDNDTVEFRKQVHALRSSSGNVGAAAISHVCEEYLGMSYVDLEADGRQYVDGLRNEFERFRHEFPQNTAALHRLSMLQTNLS